MMRSWFRRPALGLEQYVRFYVQRVARIRGAAVVHPVPARATSMIEFEFGDPIECLYLSQAVRRQAPGVTIVGPQTFRRVEMHLRGGLDCFVIMFQPDGMHRLFSLPMHELTDMDFEGHSVLGSFVSHARERLGNTGSFDERVRAADEMLLRRALNSSAFDGVSAAAHRTLHSGGRVGPTALADQAGLGMRRFERRFVQQVGMRPKLFSRIARFEAALECKARTQTRTWTDVAHSFGYYDQMHMIHDFAEFTGATPTETLSQLESVFVDQIKAMRSGAASAQAAGSARLIL